MNLMKIFVLHLFILLVANEDGSVDPEPTCVTQRISRAEVIGCQWFMEVLMTSRLYESCYDELPTRTAVLNLR